MAMRVLGPAPERLYLRTGLTLRVPMCLCPLRFSSMGGDSWATLDSPTLNVGKHANHKVSCLEEEGVSFLHHVHPWVVSIYKV